MVSRSQLLRGDFQGVKIDIRPPWAIEELRFTDLCTRCGECADNCHTSIISKGRGGFPVIDFKVGECDFCGECVSTCSPGALTFLSDSEKGQPWNINVVIGEKCLTHQNVVCQVCGELCEVQALRFMPRVGHVPEPELNIETCTGCGACISPCPVDAISVVAAGQQTRENL